MPTNTLKPGVYKSTKGDFAGAALFIVDVSDSEDNQPIYLTIFNPENNGVHEITPLEWEELAEIDGLQWEQDIPIEIKDQFLNRHSFAHLQGLNE